MIEQLLALSTLIVANALACLMLDAALTVEGERLLPAELRSPLLIPPLGLLCSALVLLTVFLYLLREALDRYRGL